MSASQETFDPYLEWLGIEPHERPVDHYRMLGVARFEADSATIAAAADERMRHVRKFQTGPRGKYTQQLLNELSAARLCLLNLTAKADYDAALQAAETPTPNYGALPPPVAPPVMSGAAVVANPTPPPVAVQPQPPITKTSSELEILEEAEPDTRSSQWLLLGIVVGGIVIVAFAVWSVGRFFSDDTKSNGKQVVETDKSKDVAPKDDPPNQNSPPKEIIVTQEGDGAVNFPAAVAKIIGSTAKLETQGGDQVVTNWTNAEDELIWKFKLIRAGRFLATVTYEAKEDMAGGEYELLLNDERLRVREVIVNDPPGGESKDSFYIVIPRNREHTLTLRPVKIAGSELMTFKSIRFEQQ